MQSNQAANPIIQSLQNQLPKQQPIAPDPLPNSLPATASQAKPTAQQVVQAMQQTGQSPLEFVRQNLRQSEPQFNPQEVAINEEKKRSETAQEPAQKIEPPIIEGLEPEKSKVEPTQTTSATTNSVSSEDSHEEPVDPSAENFKKLRTVSKEFKKKAKELEEEVQTLKTKLTEYETGTIVPEVLQEKESEIQRLSHFEKLFNFKGSKEYQDKFLKPVTELQTRLGEIAKDYEIPEEVMKEAVGIKNRKELNEFLVSHFDDVGALEVKDIVGKIQSIQNEALEAEKAPADSLNRLIAESTQVAERRKAERVTKVVDTSKSAWVEVLTSIQAEGKIPELVTTTNNEHNEKIVKPHRVAAATEYGKIVKLLAQNGLEEISPELAHALAKSVLLAHVSATAIASRNHTAKEYDNLTNTVKRTTSYERPPVGGAFASAGGGAPEQKKPASPQEAAAQHINSILSGSRR